MYYCRTSSPSYLRESLRTLTPQHSPMAAASPTMKGVLSPAKWLNDDAASSCKCGNAFSLTIRRHHCRGCGNLFCSSCTTTSPLGQYGFAAAVTSCLRCASPFVAKADPHVIPTAGGDVAFTIYNAGGDLSDLKMEFDGKAVDLTKATLAPARDLGVVLRVAMPAGRGTKHSVVIRRLQRGAAGKVRGWMRSLVGRDRARFSIARTWGRLALLLGLGPDSGFTWHYYYDAQSLLSIISRPASPTPSPSCRAPPRCARRAARSFYLVTTLAT